MKRAIFAFLAGMVALATLVTAQSGIILPSGSSTLKSIHFKDHPALGIYESADGSMYVGGTSGGVTFTDTTATLGDFSAGAITGTSASITSGSIGTFTTNSLTLEDGTYGAAFVDGVSVEEIDLGGADELAAVQSTGDLLPANALILAVAIRCTETFAGDVANFDLGDESTSTRFVTNSTKVTADDTDIYFTDWTEGDAAGLLPLVQASASKIEVLLDDAATAGKVRVAVFYRQIVAPTS